MANNDDHLAAPPVAITIAGSDSSGGAGVQADLKTFTALGVYGASAITALTAQNTTGVSAIHEVPPEFVSAQIRAVTDDLDVRAAKIGMLANVEVVKAVAAALQDLAPAPIVLDPVMVATSGDPLLSPDAVAVLRNDLMPKATLVTPNLDEAALLLDCDRATSNDEARDQAQRLHAMGASAVLLKGGHGQDDQATDFLVNDHGVQSYSRPRLPTANTHGTGCTLSAAIAAYLARGLDLEGAIVLAKDYVWNGLKSAQHHRLGRGSGPLDHMHAIRRHIT